MEKEEARVTKELVVRYGLNFQRLKELQEFLHAIQEFVQYLGTNQYYSDTVNKKIFLLTLDVDTALLRLGRLQLVASAFKEQALNALLRKEKLTLASKELSSFHADFRFLDEEVKNLHQRSLALTEDIREEYKKKEHF